MGHPFVVGGTYRNRDGEYEVVEIDGPDMVIRYSNGGRLETTVKLQARIWKSNASPSSSPLRPGTTSRDSSTAPGCSISATRRLGSHYVFGGWPDSKEPELITTAADLADGKKLLAWLSGREPGHSWLRLGVWYNDEKDRRLTTKRIADEILGRFAQVYPVYEFLLWTPDNDYR